jgi:uncharacterized membrane protein
MTADSARLDRYLEQLQLRLRELPAGVVADIVAELRSHVRDSVGPDGGTDETVAAVLERLGSPAELAAQYRTENLVVRAGRSRGPWLPLKALARWATLSLAGVFPLLGLMVGYLLAGSFFLAALAKPFAADRVGLWRLAGGELSLHLGFRNSGPPVGEELLGWWIVPLGLLAGGTAYYLTLTFARWCIARFRRDLVAPLVAPAGRAREGASWR